MALTDFNKTLWMPAVWLLRGPQEEEDNGAIFLYVVNYIRDSFSSFELHHLQDANVYFRWTKTLMLANVNDIIFG